MVWCTPNAVRDNGSPSEHRVGEERCLGHGDKWTLKPYQALGKGESWKGLIKQLKWRNDDAN